MELDVSATTELAPRRLRAQILGLAGRNFRVRVPALEKNIVPAASK